MSARTLLRDTLQSSTFTSHQKEAFGEVLLTVIPAALVAGSGITITPDEDEGTLTFVALAGGVATDSIWDAAGDLAVGTGANTATVLPIGSEGDILTVVSGTPAWVAPTSGTYSPTVTRLDASLTAATLRGVSMWSRVGDVVSVAGSLELTTDAGQVDTVCQVTLTLPYVNDVTHVFASDQAAAGVVSNTGFGGTGATFGAGIVEAIGNDDVVVLAVSIVTNSANADFVWYTFMYDVGQMEAP